MSLLVVLLPSVDVRLAAYSGAGEDISNWMFGTNVVCRIIKNVWLYFAVL